MKRLLILPLRVYKLVVRDSQTLAEYGSGLVSIMIGLRLMMIFYEIPPFHTASHEVDKILGAMLPTMFWSSSLVIVGIYQSISAAFLQQSHRKNGSMLAWVLWVFMSILFFYEPEIPLIGAVFPVMAVVSGVSYLALNIEEDECHRH